jgi:lysine biosynthesis protein LysW
MLTSRCPVCNSDVVIEEGSYESDLVTCAICGTDLEIASLHPPRLTVVPGDGENGNGETDDLSANGTMVEDEE